MPIRQLAWTLFSNTTPKVKTNNLLQQRQYYMRNSNCNLWSRPSRVRQEMVPLDLGLSVKVCGEKEELYR